MADAKISALAPAATPLAGTEVLPIVQSGSTVRVANNDLRPKQIQSNATSGVLQVVGPTAAATRVMTTPDANFTVARTDAGNAFTGNQTISGTLAAGGAALTGYQFRFTGSTSAVSGANSLGVVVDNTIAPPVGGYSVANAYISGVLTRPAGSLITDAAGLWLAAPLLNGTGTATRGTTLRISNAPTGATTNRALWVEAGASEFGADVTLTSANLVIGTAGKGIDFTQDPNPAGMTSELLDDYEEGTWTPSQGAGLTVVGAFSSEGRYTKVGRLVYVWGKIAGATSVATTAGTIMCQSFPFSAAEVSPVGVMNTDSRNVLGGFSIFNTVAYSETTLPATTAIYFNITYTV